MIRKEPEVKIATPKRRFAEASRASIICAANAAPHEPAEIGLANEIGAADTNGWLRVAPYGEHVHSGGGRKIRQIFTKSAAKAIVENFRAKAAELAGKVSGAFALPLYVGHPDDHQWAANAKTVDTRAHGWIHELEAREDGLWMLPKWAATGQEILANAHYRYLSPRWILRQLAGSDYIPFRLESVGLTNQPNIIGDAIANEQPQKDNDMKEMIKLLMAKLGFTSQDIEAVSNEAEGAPAPEAVGAALDAILTAKAEAETTLANEQTALKEAQDKLKAADEAKQAAETTLANERKARVEAIVENALLAGKITAAEKVTLSNELAADFDARLQKLAVQAPKVKTAPVEKDYGKHQEGLNRKDAIMTAANEVCTKRGLKPENPADWERAFAILRKEQPGLFGK